MSRRAASSRSTPKPPAPNLRDVQLWMVAAITGRSVDAEVNDVERFITKGPRLSAQGRFEVYRSGYHARLHECLLDDYPVLAAMLGDEAFEGLCRAYVDRHPSASPNLNGFGRHLPAFCNEAELDSIPGCNGWGARRLFASELAALEWALVEVLHAEAPPPLDVAAFQALPVERWARARLIRSEAVRLFRFEYPVNAVFIANRIDDVAPEVPARSPTAVAVYRKGVSLWRMDLTPPMARILEPILAGLPLGEALEAIEADESDSETLAEIGKSVMLWFRDWVDAGFFTRIELDPEP